MRSLLFAIVILTAAVVWHVQPFTPKENDRMNAQVKDTRTWAFGRHLIDLPSDWIYSTGSRVELYYGLDADFTTVEVRVLGTDVTAERFTDALNERSSQIREVSHSSGKSMLNSDVRPNATTARLRYFTNFRLTDYRTHELHLLVNDVYVLLKTHSFNNVMAPVEARLTALAETITTVSDPTRAGPGFGLGPIIIRDWHDQEVGYLSFFLPGSNVELETRITALQPNAAPRIQARAKEQINVPHNRLRAGSLTIATMQAEQFAFVYRNTDHHAFLFVAENYRDLPGFTQPSVHLRMRGGGALLVPESDEALHDLVRWTLPRFVPNKHTVPLWQRPPPPPNVDATLTDAEAGAVWDAMLASIRLRHNAVAPKPPSAFDRPGNPEKAAADKRALDEFLSTDDQGMPWSPPADDN
ncbi:T6SS immunity protein Tli4 family protein [Achromobacter kerstersii]|uniref:T6SS immunity protein Tli4 family protein n=1 Tax=Achromobacter kerstersii TaxID=1353890 RepID=UPI0032078980